MRALATDIGNELEEKSIGAFLNRTASASLGFGLLVALVVVVLLPPPAGAQGGFAGTDRLRDPRSNHTATVLLDGRVLVVGGFNGTFLSSVEIYDPASGTWTTTASLSTARAHHTATLLPDGRVLVAGGDALGVGDLSSIEIYEPRLETWTNAAPLTSPRHLHTATLLQDGRVLVAGGTGLSPSSAEIFDPESGAWTNAGPMAYVRYDHTATLLADGRVLVAGGAPTTSYLGAHSSTEIFDPESESWSNAATMTALRRMHTATLLPDGRVLVAGGTDDNDVRQSSVEIYTADAGSGTWTGTGSMTDARYVHSATLLPDGRVLVAGGVGVCCWLTTAEIYDPGSEVWTSTGSMSVQRFFHTATLLPNGSVLVAGGFGASHLSSAEIYAPAPGSWTSPGSMSSARDGHTATLLSDGRVLVTGGKNGGGSYLASAEISASGAPATWTNVDPMGSPRRSHTATLLPDGTVLVVGGRSGDGAGATLASAEIYDPLSNDWTDAGVMSTARADHTATLLSDGRVLVVGGFDDVSFLASAEIYDPVAESWSSAGTMSVPRGHHTATLLADGRVLVTGRGYDGSLYIVASVEIYDPRSGISGTWTSAAAMSVARGYHTATLLPDGRVLVTGGGDGTGFYISSAEIYDPASGTWTNAESLSVARRNHTATLLPDGRVLVAGGKSADFFFNASTEIYGPETGSWTSEGSMSVARKYHTATLLTDGRVLMAGGFDGVTALSSIDVYQPVGAAARARRPGLPSTAPSLTFATPFTVEGDFRADSEAGGGGSQSSPADSPVIEILSVEGGRKVTLASVPIPPESAPPGWRPNFWDDPMTLSIADLPALDRGWHRVTVAVTGIHSDATLVNVGCGVAIKIGGEPQDQTVQVEESATFEVRTRGARTWQWRRDGVPIPGANGPSYTTPLVTAADSGAGFDVVVTGACPGSIATSAVATLTVSDGASPTVSVVSPSGGEYWLLSEAPPALPNQQTVVWSMADDIRICQVEVSLLYSANGGSSYLPVPVAANFDPTNLEDGSRVFPAGGGALPCVYPGETTTSLTYDVPTTFPSEVAGSLYKVQVKVTDQAGNPTTMTSPNPHFIVNPNPDSVKTLVLSNLTRMQAIQGISTSDAAALATKLQDLANHPNVLGLVVDLGTNTDVDALLTYWDLDTDDPVRANNVLFGCESAAQAGCATLGARSGIHDTLRSLLSAYGGVKHLVLVGDDRILPLARIADGAALLNESSYVDGVNLTAADTVGQALANGLFLSDDPLASRDPMTTPSLAGSLVIPDLAVGRLVESPSEIISTIATFISQGGVLDLTKLDASTGHKVLVAGYDFLADSSRKIRKRWKSALGDASGDNSFAPVDGSLIGGNWSLPNVPDRIDPLRDHLLGDPDGNGLDLARYAVMSLNGHASHFEEGVPGTDPSNIVGLGAIDINGEDPVTCPPSFSLGPVPMAGAVVYSIGCHSGLPVSGSCAADADHSLDLPQSFLARGVVAYIGNTGFGWGLKSGIGYAERLAELMTEDMTSGGTIAFGEAVLAAKRRYVLESPRFDPYDQKTLMQWTLFGLPMGAGKPGVAPGGATQGRAGELLGWGSPASPEKRNSVRDGLGEEPTESATELKASLGDYPDSAAALERGDATEAGELEAYGPVTVRRSLAPVPDASASDFDGGSAAFDAAVETLPPYLTQLNLHFDFSAPGVYSKWKSDGTPETQPNGCSANVLPPPNDYTTPYGCYYTLNGLVERSSGATDLPVQPYFVYDSRLAGTSQHGVLWKGGLFKEESSWVPVIAELASNGGDATDHGSTRRFAMMIMITEQVVPGEDPPNCRPSDAEVSSIVVTAGEALKNQESDPTFDRQRRYLESDLEVFYFNDTEASNNNCDRTGPTIASGPYTGGLYHQVSGTTINWSVPVTDASGVWRVVLVVGDGVLDGQNRGRWTPVELTDSNLDGTFTGSASIVGTLRVSYLVQAVDKRGNVRTLTYVNALPGLVADGDRQPSSLPSSGVAHGTAEISDASLADGDSDGMADAWESQNGLNPAINDAAGDPDVDGRTNLQEFGLGTNPQDQDTDDDGDNDGSEADHGHNPLLVGDGHDMAIVASKSGNDLIVNWTADAADSSGPYYVYRSSDPLMSPSELRATLALPAPPTTWTDVDAVDDPSNDYYWVTNVLISMGPDIQLITPTSGSAAGNSPVSIYGDNFVAGSSVTFGGLPASGVTLVSGNKITCFTPAHAAGAVEVRVTSPNGQYGAVAGGFTFN